VTIPLAILVAPSGSAGWAGRSGSVAFDGSATGVLDADALAGAGATVPDAGALAAVGVTDDAAVVAVRRADGPEGPAVQVTASAQASSDATRRYMG
jgi:hypothetical protein